MIFWAISWCYIKWNTTSYEKEATNAVSEAIVQASAAIGHLVNGDLTMLDTIADTIPKFSQSDWTEIKNYLTHFEKKYQFVRISVDDLAGTAYASDGTVFNVADEEGYAKALQGISNISNPFIDKISGNEIITYYSPIKVNDEIKGVLSASRYTENLYDYLGTSFFNGKGYLHIMNQQGEVILQSPHLVKEKFITNIFDALSNDDNNEDEIESFKDAVRTGKSGIVMYTFNGTSKLIGYAPIQEASGWSVLAVIPKQVILSKASEASTAAFLLCFFFFIILVITFIMIIIGKRKKHKEIEKIAFVDELTGLPRMKKFQLDVQQVLERNPRGRYAVAQFDVDKFKYINEVFGFKLGDYILIQLANKLRENIGTRDLMGRLGGDRFILMTPYINKEELTSRIHTILGNLSELKTEDEKKYKLTINCGIYCIENNIENKGIDIPTIIDRTRIACNSLKGGYVSSHTFFDDELLAQMLEEQDIVNKMQRAMENNEFKVYLQPKTDIYTHQMVGAEALVRWEDPNKGMISPATFIPIFERNSFIVKLDFWVFEAVCRTIHKWLEEGLTPCPISINISLVTMIKSDLVTELKRIIDQYDIPASLIEIELTESIVFDNLGFLRETMMGLRSIGFTIAIDDFGSGYSSLNVLQYLPADVIKLDREFLGKRPVDETGEIVISSMVDLANKLQLKVVAEGVETEEHVAFLKSVNCGIAQGYYFAKPMPIEEFEQCYLLTDIKLKK